VPDGHPKIVATTALQSFWGSDEPDAFLGRWCLLFPLDVDRPALASRVLDYPFASRQSRLDAYRYCIDLKAALLTDFVDILNSYHRISRSARYWNVLLCGWLHRMVMTAYHHFQCLQAARASFADIRIFGPRAESVASPPTSGVLYRELWGSYRHLAIFSDLADALAIRCERIQSSEPDLPASPLPDVERGGGASSGISQGLRTIGRALAGRLAMHAESVLYNATPNAQEALWLAASSGFRIARLPLRRMSDIQWPQIDTAWRENLASDLRKRTCQSGFPAALATVLSRTLPISLLEGFGVLRDYVSTCFPPNTRAIVSGTAWLGDDAFSLWAAERSEQGARLISAQHGGSYGIREMLSGSELVEAEIVDKFLSWGQDIAVGTNTSAVPMLPHFYVRRRSPGSSSRLLYLAGTGGLLLPYGFMSAVDGPDAIDYIDRQRAFFTALPDRISRDFLIRPHPLHFGWFEKDRFRKWFPDIDFDDYSADLLQRLREAKLVVADNMNTSYLQAIGSNVPTILVWDRDRWSLNAKAERNFDRLRDAGVLYDDPAAAARAMTEIAADPVAWWTSKPVADAIGNFIRCYFQIDGGWLKPWREQLKA